MERYIEVCSTNDAHEVNRLKEQGWELIGNHKSVDHYIHDESLVFTLGFPARKRIEELQSIIDAFEKYGLKEELFKAVAMENGEKLEEIGRVTAKFFSKDDNDKPKTALFMEWYEKTLNNNKVEYDYKKEESNIEF